MQTIHTISYNLARDGDIEESIKAATALLQRDPGEEMVTISLMVQVVEVDKGSVKEHLAARPA